MKKIVLLVFASVLFFSCITTSKVNKISRNYKTYSINEFCTHGFGFNYSKNEFNSMNEFIQKHGKPQSIENSDFINKQDSIKDTKSILQYPNYEIGFLNFSKREKWDNPESMLMYISSVANGKYENGISIRDSIDKICSDLNIIKTNDTAIEYSNSLGNYVLLVFDNTKLSRIIWEYGRE